MSGRDGGFTLPLEIDPQRLTVCIEIPDDIFHIAAFWGTIDQLTWSKNWARDPDHKAALVSRVWTEIIEKANERFNQGLGCGDVTDGCQTVSLRSPRITWSPQNPFNPGDTAPPGYLFQPWTVVDNGIISGIISEFGTGYQVGDVFTDLTKLPPGDWGDILENGYNIFPRFQLNDLDGVGRVEFEFLNIYQGGRAWIILDDVIYLNPYENRLVELNRDGVSYPPETNAAQTVKLEIDTPGVHKVDVIFIPNVNDEPIPFFFGGGIRSIKLCGFSIEGCADMTEPCCDDELELLREIRDMMRGGMTLSFNNQSQANDFTVDCTPENNNGNADDDVPTQIKRANALCLAVVRWLVSVLASQAQKMNQPGKLPAIYALGGMTSPPKMLNYMEYVETSFTVAQLNIILGDDNAFNDLVCLMVAQLSNEINTFAKFRDTIAAIADSLMVTGSPAITTLAYQARKYAASRINYTLYTKELEAAFNDIVEGDTFECACYTGVCDPANFDIIGLEGTEVTRIDDNHWHVVQTNFTDAPPDKRSFKAVIRDAGWRCFNVVEPTSGWAGYDSYTCSGTHVTGVGGGTGTYVQSGMIVLEYLVDPVVGIDVIFRIECP